MGEGLRGSVWIISKHAEARGDPLAIHRNAPLTQTDRLHLALCVVDDG
ncbi:hypothetical protein ACFO4M_08635 [Pseudonocardia nematodicida]